MSDKPKPDELSIGEPDFEKMAGEVLSPMMPKETFARDTWFKAYLEGNGSWPRVTLGIVITFSECVINDPDLNWAEFENSKLSDDQVNYLGRLMTNMHKAKGIDVAHDVSSPAHVNAVPSDRLQELYSTELNNTAVLASQFMRYVKGGTPITTRDDFLLSHDELLTELNAFFSDPTYSFAVVALRSLLTDAKSFLKDPEIKGLESVYKDTFDTKKYPDSKSPELVERRADLVAEAMNGIQDHLIENFKDYEYFILTYFTFYE